MGKSKRLKFQETRQRAIFSSIIFGLVVFFFLSPLYTVFVELVSAPSALKNIELTQKNREVTISWDRPEESDILEIEIFLNKTKINDDKLKISNVDNYTVYDLEEQKEYILEIGSVDTSLKRSQLVEFKTLIDGNISTQLKNEFQYSQDNIKNIAILAILLSTFLAFLTVWVLFFKVELKSFVTIALYPSIAVFPLLILCASLLVTINSLLNKSIFAVLVSLLIGLVSYFLILTVNILNGARLYSQLPLEQAAKAAQFIIGLVSTYLILIYTFSSGQNLFERVTLILLFVSYFTYSSLSSVKEIDSYTVVLKTLAITGIMFLSILGISIWPIDNTYSILAIAVVYYIVFNISLEVRKRLSKSVWIEYGVLLALVMLLLLTSSIWGINGTLI